MPWSQFRTRLRALFDREAVERELDDELRFHMEQETAKLVAGGVAPAEAARRARAAFGGVERIKDDARDVRGVQTIESLMQDIRYAWRGLRARPAFTLGIILTLALGIGANAAMFGVVDRLLFRPPPAMRDPATVNRLYRFSVEDDGSPRWDRNLAFPTWLDMKAHATAFSDIAAYQTTRFAVGEGADVREVPVTIASANYFGFFDVRPALGRFFTDADDTAPGATVAVLGHDYWQSQYGGRDVAGEQLRVGRTVYTVIGVAPRGFTGMSDQAVPAAFIPITTYAVTERGQDYATLYGWSWLELIARRKAGVSTAEATTSATTGFVASWRTAAARSSKNWGTPEHSKVRGLAGPLLMERGPQAGRDSRVAAWLSGVALIVLLIACANVANLMLARAVSRRREVALRLALGVSRARLTRQLLTESAMLAVAGGAAGLLVAKFGGAAIRTLFLPPEFGDAVGTDMRTLAFTATATIAAALLTGIAPVWNAGRADVVSELKAGTREGGAQRAPLRTTLFVFQAALSALLLVGAGLFVRSLDNARAMRLGYDTDSVMLARVYMRGVRLDTAQRAALMARLYDAARVTPGVSAVAYAGSAPFTVNDQTEIWMDGVDSASTKGRFLIQYVGPGYFGVLGTRIVKGRALDDTDRPGTEPVTVVSEGMARLFWPAGDAIGHCFYVNVPGEPCVRIVGISEDIRLRSFIDAREFTYYVPAAQHPRVADATILFARVKGLATEHAGAVRGRLQEALPAPAYVSVRPLTRVVDPSLRAWRFAATMFVAFGGVALVLAAIGLYSMMAYDVAQRAREVSVRMALGASVARVTARVVGDGLRLVGMGLVIGGVAASWAAPFVKSLMFRQEPRDPFVFGGVAAVLILTGCVAALVPAMRAARVDPAGVLRTE